MNKQSCSVHSVFNSISDLYNSSEINGAIKRLPSVPSRMNLIDKLLKRREEIKTANELSQITKLAPVFNRLKQKFLQKLRMSRMTKNKSPLLKATIYQNSTNLPDSSLVSPKEKNETTAKRPTFVRMIASFNDHGQRRSTCNINNNNNSPQTFENLDIISRKQQFSPSHTASVLDLLENRVEKTISLMIPLKNKKKKQVSLCKLSKVFNTNNKFTGVLEKDLINFAKNTGESSPKLLETESSCKTLNAFNGKIKQKLNSMLKAKPLSPQKLAEIAMKNSLILPVAAKFIKNTSSVAMKTSVSPKRNSIFFNKSVEQQEKTREIQHDESYVSFTEMKLMHLYKESGKMKQELEKNEQNSFYDRNFRDFRRKTLRKEMKRNFNEILSVVKRKIA